MSIIACRMCGETFTPRSAKNVYCSRPCKDKGKPSASGLTCYVCSKPMVKSSTSKPQGEAAHQACAKACEDCGRPALARRKCGTHYGYLWRQEYLAANGHSPRSGGGGWIEPKRRHEIYARDNWTCYLCGDVLSVGTPVNEPKALTLDHIHPRSKGGSHASVNLKTCCRECNNRKADSLQDGVKGGGHGWTKAVTTCLR